MFELRRSSLVAILVGSVVASACSKDEPVETMATAPEPSSGGTATTTAPPAGPAPTAAPSEIAPNQFAGVVTCDQPNLIPFDGQASEVISLTALLESPVGEANPAVTLLEGGAPVIDGGTPLEITGVANPEAALRGSLLYNLRRTGGYGIRVAVEECTPVRYTVTFGREVGVAANTTKETAIPLAVGEPQHGTIGCEEHRWYALDVTRRTTFHVSVGGRSRVPDRTGELSIGLRTADGTAVMVGSNPVAAGGTIQGVEGEPTTRDIVVSRPGHYLLDLAFANACTIADFTFTVAR